MNALFALLPAGKDLSQLLDEDPAAIQASQALELRRYPQASDSAHAFSLVRDGRDRHATRWLRGTVMAVIGGAVIGALVNAILSIGFGMFSGLGSIAVALGFVLGAFLGGFTAAMTGTHRARLELRPLLQSVHAGDTLLQWHSSDTASLLALQSRLDEAGVASLLLA